MGGVTVGNRTGMVGTVAESQAADARFKGEEMAMGGVMVGDQTVMGSTGAEHEAVRSVEMTQTADVCFAAGCGDQMLGGEEECRSQAARSSGSWFWRFYR